MTKKPDTPKQRRTEALSVTWVDRNRAEGWAFGVGDCFRMQLDIRLDDRMDTEANKAKKARLGRPLEDSEKVVRRVWTQGNPPAYGFDRGHTFHELCESPEGTRRTVQVVRARPDAGALVEVTETDEDGHERTVTKEADTPTEGTGGGYVDIEILTLRHGVMDRDEAGSAVKVQTSMTQAAFAEFLRTGRMP